jgi:hypothetical protein
MLTALACSEKNEVTPLTYPQVFTGETKKAWSIRNIQFLHTGSGTQTFGLDPCVTNDLYVFYNNPEKTLQVLSGATKCDSAEPDLIGESSWSFVNATATLTMILPLLDSPPYSQIPCIVKEVDDSKMVVDVYLDEKRETAYRFNFRAASEE